tara:strand:- start:516 stop:869 length:354 start_codon:yes stop_codon:yes gene_type:complete
MAHLGTKTSDGQLLFDKYVKHNPKWNSFMKFAVENGNSGAPIVDIKSNQPVETGIVVNSGQLIHIMSISLWTLGRNKFIKIRLDGGSGVQGYLNINYIRNLTSWELLVGTGHVKRNN